MRDPFKIFVKPKNRVGKFVVNLTGITDSMLEKENHGTKMRIFGAMQRDLEDWKPK